MKVRRLDSLILLWGFICSIGSAFSQQMQIGNHENVHLVPLASTANSIELSVVNGSSANLQWVRVNVGEVPKWLDISPHEIEISQLGKNKEVLARFTFSVDKTAQVNQEELLHFNIAGSTGDHWTKDVIIVVAVPNRFVTCPHFMYQLEC